MTQTEERELIEAFNVHAALLSAERDRPELRSNPRWQIIRADAYEAFWLLMEWQS